MQEVDTESLEMCTNFPGEKKQIFKPYQFKMEEIEGFRYRAQVKT